MVIQVPVDVHGRHVVEFDGEVATLGHSGGDRRCRLHEALLARLSVGGRPLAGARSVRTDSAELGISGRPLTQPLSPFECRHLADFGSLPAAVEAPAGVTLQTDLHCHFSGCIRPRDLYAIGESAGVAYPPHILAEAGIRVRDPLPLRDMAPAFRTRVLEQLSIPLERRLPFLGLERIYRFRSVITKEESTFVPQLRQIAADYAAMGVRYVELSLSNVVEAARLRVVMAQLPAIEQETGVTVRFLGALSRHDDVEWDLDYIDRLVELADCGYIVGLDFMGMESNSTRRFETQLRRAAELGIPLRVHAGENRGYPDNVRAAVEIVSEAGGTLRVGHGLYGGDPATLALLRETGTIVEFNLNSNLALNNIQAVWQVPLVRYVRAGVRAVLGTDGYGMYGTSPGQEVRAAARAGLGPDGFARIMETEAEVLAAVRPVNASPIPPDPPPNRYTPQVGARRAAADAAQRRALVEALETQGVPLLEDADAWLAGRRPLCLAGAWKKAWERVSAPQQASVRRVLHGVLSRLDPDRYVLVSGGTHLGVEGVAGGIAAALGLDHLAALVASSPAHGLRADRAILVGETLYDKAAGLYDFVCARGGVCVFIGGGNIVSDEIQTARNLRLPYFLMLGPEGAADTHARQEPHRAFRSAAGLLRRIETPPAVAPLWRPGMNPAVDIIVLRDAYVLLVRRDVDAPCEGGKWALPGGFVESSGPWDAPWVPGAESLVDAARRELEEETGLRWEGGLEPVDEFEGGGRDPRDTDTAWVRTAVFRVRVEGDLDLLGGDDASDIAWHPLDALPPLAFDHLRILCVAGHAPDHWSLD